MALNILSDSSLLSSDTESETEVDSPTIVDLRRQYDDLKETQVGSEFVVRKYNPEICEAIEQHTRNQHYSEIWRQQRVGRITASKAHRVLHAKSTIENLNSYIVSDIVQQKT